jgi:hypothetical protein
VAVLSAGETAVAVVDQAIEGEIIAEKIEIEISLKERIEKGRDHVVEQRVVVGR